MSAITHRVFPFACSKDKFEECAKATEKTLKTHEKFVVLGFPEEVCKSHPGCVAFLMSSGFAFSIAMFKNSTKSGPIEHGVRVDENGHPLMKMNGQWQRWDYIESLLEFDSSSSRVVSKGQPAIGWNYISPEGIVQKDRYNYGALYPVEQLNQDEYQSLLDHAKQFWNGRAEIDPGQEKECIIQIVTSEENKIERNWLTENYIDSKFEHSSIRIIDEERKVYSFGIEMPPEQANFIKSAITVLGSVNANATAFDYDETRSFDARRVTSIPMTSARKDQILQYVSESNKDGFRFNFAKQSCVKFSTIVLEMAGVPVETRVTFGEIVGDMLPSISKLPVISHLFAAAAKIQEIVGPIFETIVEHTPQPIKNFFSFVGEALSFIPRKISTIFNNTLALVLGGARMSAPLPEGKEHQSKMDDKKMVDFHRLFHTFDDFFEDEKSESYHSKKLKDWQKQQTSTIIYKYEGPKMYMLAGVV